MTVTREETNEMVCLAGEVMHELVFEKNTSTSLLRKFQLNAILSRSVHNMLIFNQTTCASCEKKLNLEARGPGRFDFEHKGRRRIFVLQPYYPCF